MSTPESARGSGPRPEGRSGAAAGLGSRRDWRAWSPALRTSVAFGIVGAVLLILGVVSGATPVLIAATAAGSLSLVAALVWRSQLIEAWRKETGRPTRQW